MNYLGYTHIQTQLSANILLNLSLQCREYAWLKYYQHEQHILMQTRALLTYLLLSYFFYWPELIRKFNQTSVGLSHHFLRYYCKTNTFLPVSD
jgi:uncharacterized membrane protein